jgi:hypothetical protein
VDLEVQVGVVLLGMEEEMVQEEVVTLVDFLRLREMMEVFQLDLEVDQEAEEEEQVLLVEQQMVLLEMEEMVQHLQ